MENKELVEFIKEARKRGFGDLTIKNALITKGWPEKVIEEGFKAVDREEIERYFKEKDAETNRLKNMITLFLDDELLDSLEKRAKKNMFTLSEQIEDILRRSTLNQKNKKSLGEEKIDDTLVKVFSRKKTGPKKVKNKKRKVFK